MTTERYRPPKRYYPHQVGWITPPMAMSRVVNEFVRMSPLSVGVNHRVLYSPGFKYTIADRKRNFGLVEEAVACLAECGVDDVAQVGPTFTHSAGFSLKEMRAYQERVEAEYAVRLHMDAVCNINAMAELGVSRIALLAAYNDRSWVDGYLRFISASPLEILDAANFVEQGFFESERAMRNEGWIFDERILPLAIECSLEKVPQAEAILIMAEPCWTRPDGSVANVMAYVDALEEKFGIPIVDGEMALFWSIYKSIGVTPNELSGTLLQRLQPVERQN